MKEFIEWLGVNEKIAKLIVWISIIFLMLILTNAMLDSIGFPHYQITYQNLKQINVHKAFQYLINWMTSILNFFTIMLLVFPVKKSKSLIKYSLLYLILNIAVSAIFNRGLTEVFILIFVLVFCFLYSNKQYKYILYGLISLIINSVVQSVVYLYKAKFIDFNSVSEITKTLLFSDYFIIMGIIILVKEIYLKKRREKNESKLVLDRGIQKRRKVRKETSKKGS